MDNTIAQEEGRQGRRFHLNLSALGSRLHFVLYFLDIGALALIALAFYLLLDSAHGGGLWIQYGSVVVIAGSAFSVYAFAHGLYDWRTFRQAINAPFSAYGSIIFTFGTLLIIAFVFKITADFSRLWLTSWLISFALYITISRLALAWYLSSSRAKGTLTRKAVILGAGENGQAILDHMLLFGSEIEVIGFLDDRTTRLPDFKHHLPLLGPPEVTERLVRQQRVDLVIVALPWSALPRIDTLVKKLASWRVDIYLAPEKLGLQYADRPMLRLAGMSVLSLKDRPISEWSAVVKRIEDLCLVIPALLLLSPLLAIVALAIKLESKGPVLFIQKRFGFNNNVFDVYKFRSMYAEMADWKGSQQTSKDDPRVTKVGRLIRKTSIDELPQLFNVLLGDMSIVGPRPHPTGMQLNGHLLDDLVQEYASRHRVKPGLTGWAQCNGWRGETDTLEKLEKRVEHDLYYIENWSVLLDILAILKTLALLFKGYDRAY